MIEPYLGKTATIGWYQQSDFLGFNNSTPQLVTLSVEGEHIKTYEKTAQQIGSHNRIFTIFSFFAMLFMIGTATFMHWIEYREILYKPPELETK